jgi:hypothetical protein
MDSGTTNHVTGQRASLALINNNPHGHNITIADGTNLRVGAIGSTTLSSGSGGKNLNKVLYVPVLKRSLMSVGSLTNDGHIVVFTKLYCLILDRNNKVLVAGTGTHKMDFTDSNKSNLKLPSTILYQNSNRNIHIIIFRHYMTCIFGTQDMDIYIMWDYNICLAKRHLLTRATGEGVFSKAIKESSIQGT